METASRLNCKALGLITFFALLSGAKLVVETSRGLRLSSDGTILLRSDAAQEQNRRTTEEATRSSGARGSGEPAPSEPSRMFDDVIDTAPVAAMGEIDAATEVAREEKRQQEHKY